MRTPGWAPAGGRRRALLLVAATALVGAVGGILALGLSPPTRGDVGPGTIALRAEGALDGRTEVGVPPLGSVGASTHATPLLVDARVESVDINELQHLLTAERPTRQLFEQAESDVGDLVRSFAVRSVLAGLAGGALAGALVSRLRWKQVGVAAVGGLVAVGGLLGLTWRTFDTQAFAQPTYTGAVERAPAVIEAVRRHVEGFGAVRERIQTLGRQVTELYATAFADSRGPRPGAFETRILHVSDIHSNPLGVEVVGRLAESFDVHAVLDTGDLTSFGLPVEARIADQVAEIDTRYLFVPGNHDSVFNARAVARADNVELVDGRTVTVGGVDVLGVRDPTFTASNELAPQRAAAIVEDHADEVASLVRAQDPDVLAVHNPALAAESFGEVPLILNGHWHERSSEERDGTLRLAVGTSGASGLEDFTIEQDQPYEAQLLRFARGCLWTVDYVKVRGIGGDLEIERRTYDLVPGTGSEDGPECVENRFADPARLPPVPFD